jgi:hypothetical protein
MQHVTSTVAHFTGGYFQIITGVLVLIAGALVPLVISARQRTHVATRGSDAPHPTMSANTPNAFSRLLARAHLALGCGHPWIAFAAGLGSATPPVEYVVALTAILASGATIGRQLSAAVMFTVVVLLLVEVPLVSYLAIPAKTQAVMLALQEWLRAHRRQILTAITAIAGGSMIVTGMGSL